MRVLVCPLNWGLGHASRCVPLVKRLLADGHEPVLVADGGPLQFLRQEFPALEYMEYASYPVAYSRGKSQVWAMISCAPGILWRIVAEHRWLKKQVAGGRYDWIISDNRFGMWSKRVRSTYITHQLMIKMPKALRFLEPLAHGLHGLFISRYDECWIPDFAGADNLSGDLSHKYPLPKNARFIGPLSRFEEYKEAVPDRTYATVAVLSGVEPQRSMLEQDLLERFRNTSRPVLIVQGLPRPEPESYTQGQVSVVSHLSTEQLASVLLGAEHIIARSGYSTIMDLHALHCLDKAELIPTPGQTEQEYLACRKFL